MPTNTRGNRRKYPFPDMQVGDSFVSERKNRQTICVAGLSFSKNNKEGKWKFSIRNVSDTQIRIWRVK